MLHQSPRLRRTSRRRPPGAGHRRRACHRHYCKGSVPKCPNSRLIPQAQRRLEQARVEHEPTRLPRLLAAYRKYGILRGWMIGPRKPLRSSGAVVVSTKNGRPIDVRRAAAAMPTGTARAAPLDRKRQREEGPSTSSACARRAAGPRATAARHARSVAKQQHRLEEHHAGVPYGRRPAEQRQHHLGRHRLEQKHQQ